MAGYVDPVQPASQLDLDVGRPSVQTQQKMRKIDSDVGDKFKEKYLAEIEANRVLREMERDKAIDKAREFVKHGKSVFGPSGGGGGGGMGTGKMNRDISKNMKAGGKVKSASARADGCCIRGKTRA
jgi:hypothetical protein